MNKLTFIFDWLKGPALKPLAILIVGGIAYFLFKNIASRAMRAVIMRQERRKGKTEKEQELRARTLSRVIKSVVSVIIAVIFIFMFLQSLGINISTLLAGAGIIGIAVGLGSRSLITDYLNGFFILVEDQFTIGDVIKIGNLEGTVEDFNLRHTTLRDVDGVVHFIPNGQIKIISNLTHKWSGSILNIPLPYDEKIDKVIRALNKAIEKFSKNRDLEKYITEKPKILGIDNFGDWFMQIKVLCKTTPVKQWIIRRELLKEIRKVFEEEGIKMGRG